MITLPDRFITLIQARDAAIWATNSSPQGVPDIVRVSGIRIEPDRQHLTLFLPIKFSVPFLDNFALRPGVSFLVASLYSYESYQLKGNYLHHKPCTAEEVKAQWEYLEAFTDVIKEIGLPKEKFYQAYAYQPSVAIRMTIEEVYEQTPKKGTGEKVVMI